jgi:hypothetical protein
MRKAGERLWYPGRVVFSNTRRLLSFLLAGVIVAVILRYTVPPVYKSEFIIKPSNRGDLYFINLVLDIAGLLKDKDYLAAGELLAMPEQEMEALRRIQIDPVWKGKTKDTLNIAIIELLCTDRSRFDTFQQAILKYLEESPYYAKVRKLKEGDIQAMRAKLTQNIGEMTRLKLTVLQSMNPRDAGGYVFGEPVSPVDVYEEELKLYRQQMALAWQTEYLPSFELVKGCVVSSKPHFPKLSILLPLSVGISLVLCFIYNLRRPVAPEAGASA